MNNNETSSKRKRKSVKDLKARLSVLEIYSIVITIAFIVLGIMYMNNSNKYKQKVIDTEKKYKFAVAMVSDFNITIKELMDISETLDSQNKSLVAANEEYYAELSELREKAELYDHYSYAMVDSMGNRTDITYDQLVTLEQLMETSKVNDPDLILSWIMVESGGRENARNSTSTAKGYGQFLDGTSKFVYTNLLGLQNWEPSVALNGEINIRMMVAYIDYLYDNNSNLYGVIRGYSGKNDIDAYVAKLDSYLAYNGKSVKRINSDLKR